MCWKVSPSAQVFHSHLPAWYHTTTLITYVLPDVKALLAYLTAGAVLVSMLGMLEVVPYELTWLAILALPDALRKLFKLNAHAVSLVLHELDFWVPFVTMSLACYFASASFSHDGAAVAFVITFVISATVNILLGKIQATKHPGPLSK